MVRRTTLLRPLIRPPPPRNTPFPSFPTTEPLSSCLLRRLTQLLRPSPPPTPFPAFCNAERPYSGLLQRLTPLLLPTPNATFFCRLYSAKPNKKPAKKRKSKRPSGKAKSEAAALDQLVMSMNRRTQAMLQRIRSGVIVIEANLKFGEMVVSTSTGTGILTGRRRAITAGHVVCEKKIFQKGPDDQAYHKLVICSEIRARLPGGKFFPVKVRAVDAASDLAVLELPRGMVGLHNHVFRIKKKDLLLGQLLFYIGHPGFIYCVKCVKTGRFSSVRTVAEIDNIESGDFFLDYFQALSDENRRMLEVESPVAPGTSGVAAVNEFGSVIGIMVAGTEDFMNEAGGYIGYVVPVEYCLEILKWARGRKKTDSVFMYGELCTDNSTRFG